MLTHWEKDRGPTKPRMAFVAQAEAGIQKQIQPGQPPSVSGLFHEKIQQQSEQKQIEPRFHQLYGHAPFIKACP